MSLKVGSYITQLQLINRKQVFVILKIIIMVLLVWVAQTLFLNQAAKTGFNGWDDWGLVTTYDAFNGNDLRSFPAIARFYGSPYLWSEAYNIGIIKNIFGLNQTTLRLFELFVKSLAALSIGYLVFKLSKNKLFYFFTTFFFIIFASTAGPLVSIIFIGAYVTIILISFYILSYIKSIKKQKWIWLSSLFFFGAILVCPSRAYLIVPVPFFIELFFLVRTSNFLNFLKRAFILYLPLIILQTFLLLNGDRAHPAFMPQMDIQSRFQQVLSGNLYTLSLPCQAISSLFIDVSYIQVILQNREELLLYGFILINIVLVILSFCFGLLFKGKKFVLFACQLIGLTVFLELIFFWFGHLSLHDGKISYASVIETVRPYTQNLNPSIFQASLGGFYFVLGLLIGREWWKQQRNNLLKIIFFAWLWSVFSELLLYLTSHWYDMINYSFDRYIITCSIGVVVFFAGIFVLCIQVISKIKNIGLRLFLFFLIGIFSLLIGWENYHLLDQYYYNVNENLGSSVYWQDTLYLRFLNKFGKDNLKKSSLLFLDSNQQESAFNVGSFIGPARFRLFYSNNGNLIRGNCKAVVSDLNILKKSYVILNGEKGFLVDSICVDSSLYSQIKFYPLSDFYAYKIQNKEFIETTSEVLNQISVSTEPIVNPSLDVVGNKPDFKGVGINPGSFFYQFKRVWEKIYLLMLFQPQEKLNYDKTLYDERLSELSYVVGNNLLAEVENSTKRFSYQAGSLVSEIIKQNKAEEKNSLIKKFANDMELLAKLRDHFHANSSYWLFIQFDIDTLKILSTQLK